MAKRSAETIRAERDKVLEKIEVLRVTTKQLSAELRDVEGVAPDRSNRPKEAGYTIKPAVEAAAKTAKK